MKLSDLLAQNAQPLEITHQTRWIDVLRDTSQPRCAPRIPAHESTPQLRTMIAARPGQLAAAHALVRKRYAWRGYQVHPGEAERRAGRRAGEPVTVLAELAGELLGTLTVRPRSPLFAEETYSAEIKRLRLAGHRLGEVVKLALESGVDWKGALDALVQGAYLVSRVLHRLTHLVIEVNPRHVRFYERVLGFTAVAGGGVCARVGAPSVLMLLDLEAFGQRVRASLAAH